LEQRERGELWDIGWSLQRGFLQDLDEEAEGLCRILLRVEFEPSASLNHAGDIGCAHSFTRASCVEQVMLEPSKLTERAALRLASREPVHDSQQDMKADAVMHVWNREAGGLGGALGGAGRMTAPSFNLNVHSTLTPKAFHVSACTHWHRRR
jgi:hypothetical protein